MSALAAVLEGREVVVCAGPGGVGKTTSAAAIGLAMAARGRRVAVLTIDPARRLADSLGLEEIGGEERRVDPERLSAAGVEASGELWAAMLDAKRTWDELIERHAPDERTRDAVLGNRIYKELSSAVAGSQEYMAMEKLHELHAEGRYDLLVLDTPPTRNALDFLDAPKRLSRFVDSRSLQFFTSGGLFGVKIFSRGTGLVFSVLKRVTGVDLLQDISDFFQSFGDMAPGFRERAGRVTELLADSRTTFLLVTSPRADAVDEAVFFHDRLREAGMPFGAAVVNRMHELPADGDGVHEEVEELLGPELGRRVAGNLEDFRRLAERDQLSLSDLRQRLGRKPMIEVPDMEDDIHDLEGLAKMGEYLF